MPAPVITTTKTSPFLIGAMGMRPTAIHKRKPRVKVPKDYTIWVHESRRVLRRG